MAHEAVLGRSPGISRAAPGIRRRIAMRNQRWRTRVAPWIRPSVCAVYDLGREHKMIGSEVAGGSIDASEQDSRPRQILWLFVAIKVGLFGTALLANQLLPFDTYLYSVNLVWPLRNLPAIFEAFNTWDTQHYLLLSQQGYGTNPMSNAFYPLYPLLIRLCTPLFLGHELIAALVIANLASLAVPLYMYRLGTLFMSKEQSYKGTLLLLAFPTAFYLSAAYTESLFLLFSIAAFYHLFRGEVARASAFCFLLPLVRAQALLFILPLAVMFVQAALAKPGPKAGLRYALRTFLPPAMAAALGIGAYLLFCRIAFGSFLPASMRRGSS